MKNKFTQYIFIICLWLCMYILYIDSKNLQSALTKVCGLFILIIIQLIISIMEKFNKQLCVLEFLYCLFLLHQGITEVIFLVPIIIYSIFYSKINKYIIYSISFIFICIIIKDLNFNEFLYLILIYLLIDLTCSHYEYAEKLKLRNRNSRFRTYDLEKRLFFLDRYMEESKKVTLLKERNYIAQKLHDSLGHRITGSLMQLEVTNEMMEIDTNLSKKTLNSAVDNLKNGMDEIRLFLRNVKPVQKDINITDLRELLDKYQYQTSIRTNLCINGSTKELKGEKFNIIYENIKELLTNTAKYSGATQFNVDIASYEKFIMIIAKDNGFGVKKIKKGLGLKGIEERMNKISGKVNFYCNDGFKTVMTIMKE